MYRARILEVFSRTEEELSSNRQTGHRTGCEAGHRLRRNVTIDGRRTSVSLEGHFWDGLLDICRRETIGIDALCTAVDRHRVRSSMSSSLRICLLLYFRGLAEQLARGSVAGRGDGGFLQVALDRFQAAESA